MITTDTAITITDDDLTLDDDTIAAEEEEDLETEYILNPARFYQRQTQHLSPLRKQFFNFFEAQTTYAAVAFNWLVGFAVIASVMLVLLESVPDLRSQFSSKTFVHRFIDMSVMVIFLIDLLGRFYGCTNRFKFFKGFMNWIDIITVVPFILEAVGSHWTGEYIRYLRLLRILRLLHGLSITNASAGMIITLRAIRHSLSQIFAVLIFLLIMVVICSGFMYIAEREVFNHDTGAWMRTEDGKLKESPFQSIPMTFYWAIATLTTTGYGDVVPITIMGKIIAGITMLFGVLTIALPSSILGSNFVSEWSTYNRIRFHMRIREKAAAAAKGESSEKGMKIFNQSKAEQIRLLRLDNDRMLTAVGDIQEQLALVNPPRYFHKYKLLQADYEILRKENEALKKETR